MSVASHMFIHILLNVASRLYIEVFVNVRAARSHLVTIALIRTVEIEGMPEAACQPSGRATRRHSVPIATECLPAARPDVYGNQKRHGVDSWVP